MACDMTICLLYNFSICLLTVQTCGTNIIRAGTGRINHCAGYTMGGGPRRQGAPDQLPNFLSRCFDVRLKRNDDD